MPTLDELLYRWILRANARMEDLDLPAGIIEDSIGVLQQVLGKQYLEQLLIEDVEPVHFLDDEMKPLRKWLLSPTVDYCIIQVLELAEYFKTFREDPSLADKVQKLKHDSFWPMFFELAMAARARRASDTKHKVSLNAENASSVGDFVITADGYSIPCECSRLGNSPQITDPKALHEVLNHRISEGAKRVAVSICVKIRSAAPLNGNTYNVVLRLIRRCLNDARQSKLPCEYVIDSTTVRIEALDEHSEQIRGQSVDGTIGVAGTDWDLSTSICRVPTQDTNDLPDRLAAGECFRDYESVRLFMKFGEPEDKVNYYDRLTAKLKKKLNQTKISNEHFGKIILVEVTFDLRTVDDERLKEAVRRAASHSGTTLAIILAKREPNPHIRYQYCLSATFNQTGAAIKPEIVELFQRLANGETALDPILNSAYHRTWDEAQLHAKQIERPIPD